MFLERLFSLMLCRIVSTGLVYFGAREVANITIAESSACLKNDNTLF